MQRPQPGVGTKRRVFWHSVLILPAQAPLTLGAMTARVVRRVVIAVCVIGIGGMIAGSVADNNAVALTFGARRRLELPMG